MDQRTDVLNHIAELNSCLEILNRKIANYEQCERSIITEPEAAAASA